jgi:hypothetical protein
VTSSWSFAKEGIKMSDLLAVFFSLCMGFGLSAMAKAPAKSHVKSRTTTSSVTTTTFSGFHFVTKPSFQDFAGRLKDADAITDLFKASLKNPVPAVKFKKLWKDNVANLTALEKDFSESEPFVRGEIEDEKTMNGLMTYLELALLDVRIQVQSKNWPAAQNHFANWFTFAADFPYEEASMVGMKVTGVVRSLLLDELEKIQEQNTESVAAADAFRRWFLSVSAPWPVDRMVISESRRLLKPDMMKVASKVAVSLQKNPYETSEDVVKSLHAQDMDDAHFINSMCKKSDIEMMKTEITRIGRLKLRLAEAVFEQKNGGKAKTIEQLVQEGLLDQVPLNYTTGKPFGFSEIN